ncbi:MAG: allantoinase PuuE [Proteobacteria bacterium]|nr:allantoinase PuuE [Pseudomonadota bacterium]
MTEPYPRDLVGYGGNPPDPQWPGGARLALSFVLNYEEGGERNILDGDPESETFLTEILGQPALQGERNLFVEDIFEYGSRAGFWRVLRLFREHQIHFTSWAVGIALARNPDAARAMAADGHEVASHGWRWIDYRGMAEDEEREHIRRTVETIEKLIGTRPYGWYTGRYSENTLRLVAEEGGILYSSDTYNDDLPYWRLVEDKPFLMIPYSLDANDMKFSTTPGWMSGDDFFTYLKATFDQLRREGETEPKMMSVGLHCRMAGRPGRAAALARFLDYVKEFDDVWIAKRIDIARHWMEHHPYRAEG